MLFKCIKDKKEDKEEVTAIEMNFEFLDDFQDPTKDGLRGLVRSCCSIPCIEDDTLEQGTTYTLQGRRFPTSPVDFNIQNHVLQWMVI